MDFVFKRTPRLKPGVYTINTRGQRINLCPHIILIYNICMERKLTFNSESYYHIYNRGVNKVKIFFDDNDYFRFILLLYLSNSTENFQLSTFMRNKWGKKGKPNISDLYELFKTPLKNNLISIGAYCLMPNHIHILIKENTEGGIPIFMKKLLTSYSMYFNKKHSRTGPLFTGTYQAKHADSDNYLKYLFSYIHLNPVKLIDPRWKEDGIKKLKETKKFLEQYKYSSYLDYIGKDRLEKNILNIKAFPEYFTDYEEFNDFIEDWLKYKEGIFV
jgi:putative transposase